MYVLDTYALVEISKGNKKFLWLKDELFVVPNIILTEFYRLFLKEGFSKKKARELVMPYLQYTHATSCEAMLDAMDFWKKHRKERISLFDAIAYYHALDNDWLFVTGDKEFKEKKNVKFIKA